jgi:CheY-like chemotaxis protein
MLAKAVPQATEILLQQSSGWNASCFREVNDVLYTEDLIARARSAIAAAPEAVRLGKIGRLVTMNGKRILVVDDSVVIRKATSMKLVANGYEVITAEDGGEAVAAVRRSKPDLILLDISFPPDVAHGGGVAWDGFLIMEWLRRLDEARGIPIVVITGGDPVKFKDRALAAGAVSFFHKPIDNDELLAVIRKVLEEKSGSETTTPKSPAPPAGPAP